MYKTIESYRRAVLTYGFYKPRKPFEMFYSFYSEYLSRL